MATTLRNKPRYSYVSFDMDDTLISKQFDLSIWYREIPLLYAKTHNMSFDKALGIIKREYDAQEGKPHWADISFWFKHFGLKESWQDVMDKISHEIVLFPDTIPCLTRLSKSHKLILVSAAERKFLSMKMKLEMIEDFFFKIISTSSDLGCVSKSPDTYKKILNMLDIDSAEIVHIGDNPTSDYEYPRKAGIRSILIARKEVLERSTVAESYEDRQTQKLKMLIGKIDKDDIIYNLDELDRLVDR